MSFGEPQFLYALALVPVMALLLFWTTRRQRAALRVLGDRDLLRQLSLSVNQRGRRVRNILWFVSLILLAISLARPQWGSIVQSVERQGAHIMVVLDVSQSMLAQDLLPDRLTRAKLEISDLMSRLKGDEVGLVLFAGAGFIQFPLTFDYATAQPFLRNASPQIISRQGTAIADAIDVALTGFDPQLEGQKVILILTDGENHEGDPILSARQAAQQGVVIYTVGIGFPQQGQPIPVFDNQGNATGFKINSQGEAILSRLDEAILQSIANETQGRYFRASDGGVAASLSTEIANLQKAKIESENTIRPVERFQWFLSIALLVLVAAELVPERNSKQRPPSAEILEAP